jgi:hypothetical protein
MVSANHARGRDSISYETETIHIDKVNPDNSCMKKGPKVRIATNGKRQSRESKRQIDSTNTTASVWQQWSNSAAATVQERQRGRDNEA